MSENVELRYGFDKLRWHKMTTQSPGRLVLPITDIRYGADMDELVGQVESRDTNYPGWVTMPVIEAEGSEYVETVRNAKELTFLIPAGYEIENMDRAKIRLRFRNSNSHEQLFDYDEHNLVIPERF